MGGILSGLRGRRGGKRSTEHLPEVRLTHDRLYDLHGHGRQPGVIPEPGGWATVRYGVLSWTVALGATPLHFGGSRRWLICPVCWTRRQSLFIDGPRLACRACLALRYESQHQNRRQRQFRAADRARKALGWEPGILNPVGPRPKGMHWATFARRVTEMIARSNACLGALPALIERIEATAERRRNSQSIV